MIIVMIYHGWLFWGWLLQGAEEWKLGLGLIEIVWELYVLAYILLFINGTDLFLLLYIWLRILDFNVEAREEIVISLLIGQDVGYDLYLRN